MTPGKAGGVTPGKAGGITPPLRRNVNGNVGCGYAPWIICQGHSLDFPCPLPTSSGSPGCICAPQPAPFRRE